MRPAPPQHKILLLLKTHLQEEGNANTGSSSKPCQLQHWRYSINSLSKVVDVRPSFVEQVEYPQAHTTSTK